MKAYITALLTSLLMLNVHASENERITSADDENYVAAVKKENIPMKHISNGVVHDVPADLKKCLISDSNTLALWEDLTPLARNEWICWMEDAKKDETRLKRIGRVKSDLEAGKRRPCCWPGCSHRNKNV